MTEDCIEKPIVKIFERLGRIDESLSGEHGLHSKIDELNGRICNNTNDIKTLNTFKDKTLGVTKITVILGLICTVIGIVYYVI